MVQRLWCTVVVIAATAALTVSAVADPIGLPIETLEVSAESYANVPSATILTAGQQYYILAEGSYRHATPGHMADAEWDQHDPAGPWLENAYTEVGPNEHDLLINDTGDNWRGSDETAPDPVSAFSTYDEHEFSDGHHTYWLPFEGAGLPVRFSIQDVAYADNDGSLTVSIYLPEPTSLVMLMVGAIGVLGRRR